MAASSMPVRFGWPDSSQDIAAIAITIIAEMVNRSAPEKYPEGEGLTISTLEMG